MARRMPLLPEYVRGGSAARRSPIRTRPPWEVGQDAPGLEAGARIGLKSDRRGGDFLMLGGMGVPRRHAGGEMVGRRSIWEAVLPVVTAGVLVFLANAYVIQIFTVSSASMAPTLLSGDSVFVNRIVYRLHPPGRGDIIALLAPRADGREFVKRVVGLPGDVVTERDGHFFVNGAVVAETQGSATAEAPAPAKGQMSRRVPAGQLYVLGDNPGTSMDSRFWGTVDEREVVGKAFLICWSRGRHGWEVRWGRIGSWLR